MATIFDELMSQSALLTRTGKKAKNESIRKIYYKNIKVESIKRLVNEEVDSDLDFDIPEDIEDDKTEDEVVLVIDPEIGPEDDIPEDAAEGLVGDYVYKCPICGANYVCECNADAVNESVETDEDGVPTECPICGEEADQILVGEIAPVDGAGEAEKEMDLQDNDSEGDTEEVDVEEEEEEEEPAEESVRRNLKEGDDAEEDKEVDVDLDTDTDEVVISDTLVDKYSGLLDKSENGETTEREEGWIDGFEAVVKDVDASVDLDKEKVESFRKKVNSRALKMESKRIARPRRTARPSRASKVATESLKARPKKVARPVATRKPVTEGAVIPRTKRVSRTLESSKRVVRPVRPTRPMRTLESRSVNRRVSSQQIARNRKGHTESFDFDDLKFNTMINNIIKEHYAGNNNFKVTDVSARGNRFKVEYVVREDAKKLTKGTFIGEGFNPKASRMILKFRDKGVFTESLTKTPSFTVRCVVNENVIKPVSVSYDFKVKMNEGVKRVTNKTTAKRAVRK